MQVEEVGGIAAKLSYVFVLSICVKSVDTRPDDFDVDCIIVIKVDVGFVY